MKKMQVLAKELEVKLGPDTGDLSMRFGLHSGPVTAGVLRGERSRFQLFGDTGAFWILVVLLIRESHSFLILLDFRALVNTAARIESTGQRGRIHLSEECANEIMRHNKAHWVQPREDKVSAKGKGELTTFWLGGTGAHSQSSATSSHVGFHPAANADSEMQPLPNIPRKSKEERQKESDEASKKARLVDWNVDILQRLLKQIEARRVTVDEEHKEEKSKEKEKIKIEDPALKPLSFLSSDSAAEKVEQNPDDSRHGYGRRNSDQSQGSPVDTSRHGTNSSRHGNVSSTSASKHGKSFEIPEEISEVQETGDRIYTDEVAEVITMPKFDKKAVRKWENAENIVLEPEVIAELHDFVETISSLYRANPFHNFEHASHVTMSVCFVFLQ